MVIIRKCIPTRAGKDGRGMDLESLSMLVGMEWVQPQAISVEAESRVRYDSRTHLSPQLGRSKQEDQGYPVSHGADWVIG